MTVAPACTFLKYILNLAFSSLTATSSATVDFKVFIEAVLLQM